MHLRGRQLQRMVTLFRGRLAADVEWETGGTEKMEYTPWSRGGKMLISGSNDHSTRSLGYRINTPETNHREGAGYRGAHQYLVSLPLQYLVNNGCILAIVSFNYTAQLWHLDNNQPISSPLHYAEPRYVGCFLYHFLEMESC
jgi:hypothetical protein